MYIVWRDRPLKGAGGGRFLDPGPGWSELQTCWMPLRCEHRGPGRRSHTPLVVVSERREGVPRQRVLERFPAIRDCCIADPFCRAAWWHRVDVVIGSWSDAVKADDPRYWDYSRDGPELLRRLRAVVPRPTSAGVARFTDYRLGREAELARRKEDERARRAQQDRERESARRAWEQREHARQASARSSGVEGCFAVLNLREGASEAEIKARYRELAKVHHPDAGGDEHQFVRVERAYRRAMELASLRSSARYDFS